MVPKAPWRDFLHGFQECCHFIQRECFKKPIAWLWYVISGFQERCGDYYRRTPAANIECCWDDSLHNIRPVAEFLLHLLNGKLASISVRPLKDKIPYLQLWLALLLAFRLESS